MKKQNVKKTVLKEEELTKVVGGSTARIDVMVFFNAIMRRKQNVKFNNIRIRLNSLNFINVVGFPFLL